MRKIINKKKAIVVMLIVALNAVGIYNGFWPSVNVALTMFFAGVIASQAFKINK